MTTVDLRTEARQILDGLSEANLPVAVSLLTALKKQEAPKRTELLAVYPWARSLSDEERDEFFSDLSQATTHAHQNGDGSIVEEVIFARKETAEIVADPEMMADIASAEVDIEKGKVVHWDQVKRKLHIG